MVLPKQNRLRRSSDFAKVYRYGKKAVSAHLVVRTWAQSSSEVLSSSLASAAPAQIGIAVSQKVSKRAVVRNRLKRRIRAAMRDLLPSLNPQVWVVITVRSEAVECEYGEFLRELKELLNKLEVIHGS